MEARSEQRHIPYRWIGSDAAFREELAHLRDEPVYALDTEFHRERTYHPRVALVQLARPGSDVVLEVDPLAVDLSPLAEVLAGPGLAVMHACSQDLEVLDRVCGTRPARLFDTQLAAGFLGYSTPSLASLLHAELEVRLPKGDRLTDWLRRPLTEDQCEYAASDVEYLIPLYERVSRQLDELGRLPWALDECEDLRTRPVGPPDPEQAWLRLKEHRSLRGPARGIAQAVAAWRERRAAELDQPVRSVLPDLALISMAQRPPRRPADLSRVRGLDGRHVRGSAGEELFAAIEHGRRLPAEEIREPRADELPRELRPAVTLVSAWVSQLARDARIDTSLLATRADLVDLLGDPPSGRLTEGWRAELIGDAIQRLVGGDAALAFDARGHLVLEERSGVVVRRAAGQPGRSTTA